MEFEYQDTEKGISKFQNISQRMYIWIHIGTLLFF